MSQSWRRPKTHVGRMFRKQRRILCLTQAEAAKTAGYSRQHFNQLENGRLLLRLEDVLGLAEALGIDEDALMHAALEDRMPDGWEAVQK